MIMKRDKEALDFIDKFKIATTDTLAELFYPSIQIAQRRLKILTDDKHIKRERDHFTMQYHYYQKKTTQSRHSILLTDFYRELNKIADIEFFDKEFSIGNMRSDGLVVYKKNNTNYVAFIEVQIANTPIDIDKYEKLYRSGTYKSYFNNVFPLIIVITNKSIPKTKLKVIKVNENINLEGLI